MRRHPLQAAIRSPANWSLFAVLLCASCGKDGITPAEPGFLRAVSRSALAATDNLDWGDLGPPSGSHPQPVTILSDDGVSVVVTNSVIPPGNFPAPFNRAKQNFFGGWRGNFAFGDELIYTGGAQVITIDFPTPVAAAGMQVQPGSLIASFTVRIEALSAGGAVLASFEVAGVSSDAEDNSAPFVGIRAMGGAAFDKVRITNLTLMSNTGIAINRVDFAPAASVGVR